METAAGVAVAGSWPAIVTVYPGATSASTSEMDVSRAFPATTTAGTRIAARIVARDAEGNAKCYSNDGDGGDALRVDVSLDGAPIAGDAVALRLVQDKADGSYDVQLTPRTVGTYAVAVRLEGTAIAGSPSSIVATHGAPNASASFARGAALFGGVAGVASVATLHAKDANGNAVSSGLADGDCG